MPIVAYQTNGSLLPSTTVGGRRSTFIRVVANRNGRDTVTWIAAWNGSKKREKKRERKVARFRVIPRREQCRCSMGVGFQGILKGHDPSKGTRVARRTSCRGIGARPLRENDNFFFRKGRILGLAGTRSTLDWQQEWRLCGYSRMSIGLGHCRSNNSGVFKKR